jgi:hypothetical protein
MNRAWLRDWRFWMVLWLVGSAALVGVLLWDARSWLAGVPEASFRDTALRLWPVSVMWWFLSPLVLWLQVQLTVPERRWPLALGLHALMAVLITGLFIIIEAVRLLMTNHLPWSFLTVVIKDLKAVGRWDYTPLLIYCMAIFALYAVGFYRQWRAVVVNRKQQLVLVAAGAEPQHPRRGIARDAVLHGVLRQRLEHQAGHQRREAFGRDVILDLQPVLEADALDLEVAADEIQFALERVHRLLAVLQRAAQELAEAGDDVLGLAGAVVADEAGDGVERVEQEVRVQLHLQRVEAGAHEAGLEPGVGHAQFARQQLPGPPLAVEPNRIEGEDRHAVDQERRVVPAAHGLQVVDDHGHESPRQVVGHQQPGRLDDDEEAGDEHGHQDVQPQRQGPAALRQRQLDLQPQDQRREEPPQHADRPLA